MRTKMQLKPKITPSVKLSTTLVYAATGIAVASIIGAAVFIYLNFGNSDKVYAAGSTYNSNGSGNWTTNSVWGGTAPPTNMNGDNVTVKTNHDIQRSGNLNAQNGVTLSIQASGKLTIVGDLVVQNNFTLNNSGTLIVTGNIVSQNGAQVTVNGGGVMNVGGNVSFGNNGKFKVNGNLTVGGNVSFGSNGVFNGSGTINISGTGCSGWTGTTPCNSGPSILPVKLLSFTAKDNGDQTVKISWATATEINNDYFTIERSQDGTTYSLLATIKGNGTVKSISRYEYQDSAPNGEKIYYRLTQTDFDGTTEVFAPVFVEISLENTELSAFPNPLVDRDLTVTIPKAQAGVLYVVDYRGNTILSKEIDGSSSEVQLAFDQDLPSGLYYINYKTGSGSSVKSTKIVKR